MQIRKTMGALLMGAAIAGTAAAQPAYPSAPIRLVLPHSTGAVADIVARGLADRLASSLGQPVIVDNRPGAGGIIGASQCARAPADGYTLCLTNNDVISINPFVYKKLPYDPVKDLAPIVHLANITGVIAVRAGLPVNSAKAFVEMAKSKPGSLKWGSFGVGSIGHIYVDWLQKHSNVSILHVPYNGAGPTVPALLSGEVDAIVFSAGGIEPYVKDGRAKVIAILGSERVASMPQVATFVEQGFEFRVNPWIGMFAPSGTPKDIVQKLNGEINRILNDPAFRARYLEPQTVTAVGGTPDEFAAFLRADREDSAKGIGLAGIKLD